MNILSLTAGAASMYCGSCLRDNALAAELIGRGHAVTLLPVYTPTLTDEPNVSKGRVFFGGISVYLQQHMPFFRWTPAFLDKLWDSGSIINMFAKRSIQVDARMLGELTVSMLKGEHGHQRKELDKMIAWLRTQPAPDVINLPFTLLIGLARPLREAFGVPIVCTLQGEDLFLDQLHEPYKNESLRLIRQKVKDVDRFIAVSSYYAKYMAGYLSIPADRIRTVPLGINLRDYESAGAGDTANGSKASATGSNAAAATSKRPFTIGYFARIAPEKGLDKLAAAYRLLRKERGLPPSRLEVAGYLGGDQREYLDRVELMLRQAGLHTEYRYHGELDRAQKVAFFKQIDVFSMPTPYREPKGFSVLEAMASGVPVVQPRHGAFPEVLEKTGGGLLVNPDDVDSLAEGIWQLWQDREERVRLGRQGAAGVRQHYTIARMADGMVRVYSELTSPAGEASRESSPPSEAAPDKTSANAAMANISAGAATASAASDSAPRVASHGAMPPPAAQPAPDSASPVKGAALSASAAGRRA
jgi:glycosyltransferase involved in cell wall biosynthesis